jgi:hypothetical protein
MPKIARFQYVILHKTKKAKLVFRLLENALFEETLNYLENHRNERHNHQAAEEKGECCILFFNQFAPYIA